jgi:hypothetical protein
MTDRELLEKAAKAAGIVVDFQCTQWGKFWAGTEVGFWNPLTDDGDALRLAVKLKFNIEWDYDEVYVHNLALEDENDDPYAAIRRAIVRAAAAIGDALL